MLDNAFEAALHSADPVKQLRELAIERLKKGQAREVVLADFEQVRQQLRAANREKDEDVVMDVMDFLSGWCSPHMKIPVSTPELEEQRSAGNEE
jgi:hypothetical protein